MSQRKILVTAALPYANGPIHIGHLVEYIQTDIWVRFQRLRGHRCIFMWADDTHGSAIMKSARKAGITEDRIHPANERRPSTGFSGFGISYDYYGSTHSETNRQIATEIWSSLRKSRG